MKKQKLNSGTELVVTETAAPVARALVFAEALDLSEATADADARTIRDVVLIKAGMSANRRYYPEKVLREAQTVFEGAKAYADHPSKAGEKNLPERSVRDLTGWYEHVRYENGALRADRVFSRTQAGQDVWALAEDIVSGRAPKTLAGLSIRASGVGAKKDYEDGEALEVEAITAAISVDDVTTPAAGGMYLAASAGDDLTAGLMEALSFDEWREARPEFVEQLKKEWQVVRQTDALKAAQAESEARRVALESAEQALNEAQAQLTAHAEQDAGLLAETRREADEAIAARDAARRDLEIEQLLRKAKLPTNWEASLRTRLMEADRDKWPGILKDEHTKAKFIAKPESTQRVGGAEPQVMPAVVIPDVPSEPDPHPLEGENVADWQKRISRR